MDTSALVKLVVPERESAALRDLARGQQLVACAVVRTELPRAVRRLPGLDLGAARAAVGGLLDGLLTVPVDDLLLQQAADVGPTSLRSLDALHLAAAVTLAGRLDAFVVYDRRLAEAAAAAGLPVASPGAGA